MAVTRAAFLTRRIKAYTTYSIHSNLISDHLLCLCLWAVGLFFSSTKSHSQGTTSPARLSLCRSYVDTTVLSGEALSSGASKCASTHLELTRAPPLQERSLTRPAQRTERSSRRKVIRVDRLRSREHPCLSRSGRGCRCGPSSAACASHAPGSATLGYSMERVNSRLALERRCGYRPSSRFSCGM